MNYLQFLTLSTLLLTAPLAVCAGSPSAPTDVSQQKKPRTLKVLLLQNQDSLFLDVTGGHKVYNPITQLLIGETRSSTAGQLSLKKDGIFWEENYPGVFQIRIVPSDASVNILVNGIQYKGCVEICEVGGKLAVLNEVDVENYLKATLAKQRVPSVHPEVLNSLAIAARTNLYYLIDQNHSFSWDLEAAEQNYVGHALTAQNPFLEKAIRETAHVVMSYEKAPFATAWGVDSGGHTASYASIFRKNTKGPQGVFFAASEQNREKRKWSFTLPKSELAKRLKVSDVSGMDLFVDKNAGKVYGVKVVSSDSFQSMDFFSFQKQLGASQIKSNDFQVKLDKDRVIFEGVGEGSGVGLCLYSAEILAQHGKTASEILKTFYPGVKMENFSP